VYCQSTYQVEKEKEKVKKSSYSSSNQISQPVADFPIITKFIFNKVRYVMVLCIFCDVIITLHRLREYLDSIHIQSNFDFSNFTSLYFPFISTYFLLYFFQVLPSSYRTKTRTQNNKLARIFTYVGSSCVRAHNRNPEYPGPRDSKEPCGTGPCGQW
jgi:hypothetical protein